MKTITLSFDQPIQDAKPELMEEMATMIGGHIIFAAYTCKTHGLSILLTMPKPDSEVDIDCILNKMEDMARELQMRHINDVLHKARTAGGN